MADSATPNLPSRDFLATQRFYSKLGFECSYRAAHWMILERGNVCLEFFPWPDLEPSQNSNGCCIRLKDLSAMIAQIRMANVPEGSTGIPRLVPPQIDISGLSIAYLIDPNGTLLRLVQNPAEDLD